VTMPPGYTETDLCACPDCPCDQIRRSWSSEIRAVCEHCRIGRHAAQPIDVERKPDGWHTYHICGGQLREVTRVDSADLFCVYCGEWFVARLRASDR